MKASRMLAPALLLAVLPGAVVAQDLAPLKALWRSEQYRQVLPLLLQHRTQPGGRNWQVDYLIGTSQCRLPGEEARGIAMLKHALANYRLPETTREVMADEVERCRARTSSQAAAASLIVVPVAGQVETRVATVSGKGGYLLGGKKVLSTEVKATPVPVDELEKRVFLPGQEAKAMAAAGDRVQSKRVAAVEGFVVACDDACLVAAEEIGRCLATYKAPLKSRFDLAMPSGLVTVYVVEDVGRMSERLHGLRLPYGTVAYSVYEDLSIVGSYEGLQGPMAFRACGSLAHELVHLAMRRDFGDSPAWLEEGVASEVAVSSPQGETLEFRSSWRDGVLQRYWGVRPTVRELVATNWASFSSASPDDQEKLAALNAMAATFVRYLDAKGKLDDVFTALRDKRVLDASVRTDSEILEQQLGKSLDEVDADFVKWFKQAG